MADTELKKQWVVCENPQRFVCYGCEKEFAGNYERRVAHVARVAGHRILCCTSDSVPPEVIELAKKELLSLDDGKRTKQAANAKKLLEPTAGGSASLPAKKGKVQLSLAKSIEGVDKSDADGAVAKWAYAKGIPFNSFEGPEAEAAAAHIQQLKGSTYKFPNRKALGSSLLDKQYEKVDPNIKTNLAAARHFGWTQGTDGWTNNQKRPATGYTASTSVRSILTDIDHCLEPTTKSGEYIRDGLLLNRKRVDELTDCAPQAQLLTDDAANCVVARELFAKTHPEVTVGQCSLHGCGLFFGDANKECWLADIAEKTRRVVKYLRNHEKVCSACQRLQKEANKTRPKDDQIKFPGLPAETRMAGVQIMEHDVLKAKGVLRMAFNDQAVTDGAAKLSSSKAKKS